MTTLATLLMVVLMLAHVEERGSPCMSFQRQLRFKEARSMAVVAMLTVTHRN